MALPAELIHIATNPDTEPFWEAAKRRQLTACQCGSCGRFRMPPSPFCPNCRSKEKTWPLLSGAATIFSFSVVRGYPGRPDLLLIPVVVDLPDAPGARLVSNVVDATPDEVEIGATVTADFSPASDGFLIPIFRLVRS